MAASIVMATISGGPPVFIALWNSALEIFTAFG
jgi:hypothetical protein